MRLKNPAWINKEILYTTKVEDISDNVISAINNRLATVISDKPLVSVVIAAYNEEVNIIRCLDSLSNTKTTYPLEIVVVDNNSKDKTAEVIRKFNVTYAFQKIQGCGIARQLGQETAKGTYILTADADTLYPPDWIDKLMAQLQKPGVVCVYGRYSFISDEKTPRWKLTIYETLSDVMCLIKAYKRPYLNVLGMTMGYIKELGLKVGFVEEHIRGEDGRLAFDLMKFGKIKGVMSSKARVWTITRTISQDGRLRDALWRRVLMALANFEHMFTKEVDHDTKTSKNSTDDVKENLEKIKGKFKI
jgi:glycosyltransferase involved in cell wall biosynthesis